MRISIVSGFFLPVPPVSGGSTEKSWYNLARHFAARGHAVTFISRQWKDFPHSETSEGVRHVRLRGADFQRQQWRNLLLDLVWSCRVFFALQTADIVVVNTITLPIWLGLLKPRAGRVVIMTGRMPKGQYRHYHRISRALAASSFVREKVIAENPTLAAVSKVYGYPIDWDLMNRPAASLTEAETASVPGELTIGYVGRIHEEKGLMLLADALKQVGATSGLPPWRLLLCGPSDVARGGSGDVFRSNLLKQLSRSMPADRFTLLDPQFNEASLAGVYRRMAIFCYPSLAAQGETFGVAVAEAMAAGAVPIVSHLACFTDFVRDGKNGLVFDHDAPDAASRFAAALVLLLRESETRQTLARAAQTDVRAYDYATYADRLLADFEGMIVPVHRAT